MAEWTIVGVDCASQDRNVGLALARLRGGQVAVDAVQLGGDPLDVMAAWVRAAEPVLLAIDAPLGWPATMCAALASHQAGAPLGGDDARALFRRETDLAIARATGKTPLDVGADRIAYAAFRALWFLGQLRERTGKALPLLWAPEGSGAIEVYPAATLRARGLETAGYKQKSADQRAAARAVRGTLLAALTDVAVAPAVARQVLEAPREDLLDAIVAASAGADFLRGLARGPACADAGALARVRREGWIWCRERAAPG